MQRRSRATALAASSVVLLGLAATALPAQAATSDRQQHRYLVVADSEGDYAALKASAARAGAKVRDLGGTQTFAVQATAAQAATIKSSSGAQAVARDHIAKLIDPEGSTTTAKSLSANRHKLPGRPGKPAAQDPAYQLPGLMWNLDRIRSPKANKESTGRGITVAVADTGVDYTHSELKGRVTHVEDFTTLEDPPICETYVDDFGDADLAAEYGGPVDGDWNGHGTWIAGNIAANLDKVGINGIAPKVDLVSLKISQWCGSAYDSEILAAFEYAGKHRIDVVSISFGGYLDRSDPEQDAIYKAYVDTVATAKRKGTLIVSSAGNDHVRLGAGGKVISHGPLTIPGDTFEDYYGLWETPAGIPGVIAVSATGNVTAAASATCTPATADNANAVCKRATDAHQPYGVGKKDQLTYYSNYGPRIDIAAPGGSRKFNLPNIDGGGTPGFPVTTDDGTTAFQDFSITSNFALEIPCYTFTGGPFYPDQCYSTIQGTSMATPHVSAAAALVAAKSRFLEGRPSLIAKVLKATARDAHNYTPPLSATDTSPGDRVAPPTVPPAPPNPPCTSGYCHLGGRAISDRDAYGAGVLDAYAAVKAS